MPNAVEIKKRLNAIAAAAIQTFNSHKTKKDKNGAVIENNYNFTAAAKAMVQEAFDLGRAAVNPPAFQPKVEEPIAVDQEDDNPANTEPVTPAPEETEAP